MWAEFIQEFFFCPGFLVASLQKTTDNYKFQLNQDRGVTWKPAKADVTSSINIVI